MSFLAHDLPKFEHSLHIYHIGFQLILILLQHHVDPNWVLKLLLVCQKKSSMEIGYQVKLVVKLTRLIFECMHTSYIDSVIII